MILDLLLDLLFIQILVCYIIDLSGFIPSLEMSLSKWLKIKAHIPKPFSCSLCSGWWLGLIYLLVTGQFGLSQIVIVAGLSFFSKHISGFIRWMSELMVKLESILYKWIR